MKTKIFTLIAFACLAVLSSCEQNNEPTYETLNIEVESDGGVYTFASNTVEVIAAPNDFNVEVTNNTIVGRYVGETTAQIKSDNIIYNCNINVEPSYTYYVDMAIYIGWSKDQIEKLYGEPINVSDDLCAYNPMSEYLPESMVAFIYENGVVRVAASYFTLAQGVNVINHLGQRYAAYGVEDHVGYYGNALKYDDATLYVTYDFSETSYTYAMYFRPSSSKASVSEVVPSMADAYRSKFADLKNAM